MMLCLLMLAMILKACSADEGHSGDPGLEEMIGQMLMIGFRGMEVEATDQIARDLAAGRVGGVILFDRDVAMGFTPRNIESPAQLMALTGQLRHFASQAGDIPLFISIDQEGGYVARLKPEYGFPSTVSAQYLGSLNDPDSTAWHSARMAQTLSDHGINLNLAPVVDVNINPDSPAIGAIERSFSDDPLLVAQHAAIVVDEHRARQVLTCLKHFPGHGSASHDSHLGLTDVSNSWEEQELIPYEMLIGQGRADMVMTAHIFNSQWDTEYPATLSKEVITGMLRQELGFDGVIISDDMNMGAITDEYGLEEAIYRSIDAGVDVLIFANNLVYDEMIAETATAIILDLIDEGMLSVSRIRESYQRIMLLKDQLP